MAASYQARSVKPTGSFTCKLCGRKIMRRDEKRHLDVHAKRIKFVKVR